MKRKDFIKTTAAASLFTALPYSATGKSNLQIESIKPKRLKKGDTVGLISPGGFISEKELNESIANLENLGFKVQPGEAVLGKHGYLGGNDKQRADDMNKMFADSKIDGIFCSRGGYGCSRILPLLDYKLIKNNPKALIGYSDITALFYGIYAKTGLVGFHGPVGISTFNEYSVNLFRDVMMSPKKETVLLNAEETNTAPEYQREFVRSGTAEGILGGGNLSIVVSLIGTPYDVDSKDKIFFIEEVSEEPYRVDRMLTQMIQAGKFDNAAGIALGVFSKCHPRESISGIGNSFSLMEVIYDRLFDLGIPVVYGMSFGHITNKMTLPFGVKTKLDVDNYSLTLLEPAVE
jgi:muramoyltetrapeptide carboxypeptidase